MSFKEFSISKNSSESVVSESKPLEVIIPKPHYVDTCSVQSKGERLPLIKERNIKAKKVPIPRCKKSSSESLQEWLKPGVSLPKLKFQRKEEKIYVEETQSRTHLSIPPDLRSFCGQQDSIPQIDSHFSFLENEMMREEAKSSCVAGISKCLFPFNVPAHDLIMDKFEAPEKPLEESHSLRNWQLWLRRRNVTQEYLKKGLNKNECDLVLNSADNYRKVKETEELFMHEQEKNFDKTIRQPKPCVSNGKRRSRTDEKERKKLKPVEFIGVPTVIQKEKNMCKNEILNESRHERCYFKNQKAKLEKYEVNTKELAVIGHKIPQPVNNDDSELQKFSNLPVIKITEPEEQENNCPLKESRQSIVCLVIDDVEIKYELGKNSVQDSLEQTMQNATWDVTFGVNEAGTFVEREIKVENKGTVAVSYDWIMDKPLDKQYFQSLSPREPWYFFDKNSGIFVPGQIYHLKFYHRAQDAGIRKEIWYMKTSPPIFAKEQYAKFVLMAVATSDHCAVEIELVNQYLKRRVSETLANWILDRLLYMVTDPKYGCEHIEYRSFCTEKLLFLHHNPRHHYHSNLVKELKRIFMNMYCGSTCMWDFSLHSLIFILKNCVTEKTRKDKIWREINEFARRLLRPSYVVERGNKKYRMSYQVLCRMFNFFEADFNYFRNCVSRKFKDRCYKSEYGELDMMSICQTTKGYKSDNDSDCGFVEINTINSIYFDAMLYSKVYRRLCEAVEQIVGVIETRKFLEPRSKKCARIK